MSLYLVQEKKQIWVIYEKLTSQNVNQHWRKMNYENCWIVMKPVIIIEYIFLKIF